MKLINKSFEIKIFGHVVSGEIRIYPSKDKTLAFIKEWIHKDIGSGIENTLIYRIRSLRMFSSKYPQIIESFGYELVTEYNNPPHGIKPYKYYMGIADAREFVEKYLQ